MGAGASSENNVDGWRLRFDEPLVTQLRVDNQFSLLLQGGALIAIAEPFELRTEAGTRRVPPGDAVYEVADALPLFNQEVVNVHAAASGELSICFNSGAVIEVPVNDYYESWEVVLQTGELWVGLPGGGVEHVIPS
jgi:Family of unknown function (DUF6188)